MLRISEIKLGLDSDFSDIENTAAKALKIDKNRILKTEIYKNDEEAYAEIVDFVKKLRQIV